MKKIQPKKEIKKIITTNNIQDISQYVIEGQEIETEISMGEVVDNLTISPYLWNVDRTAVAQYNQEFGAVGYYKEVGEDVKRLVHLDISVASKISPFQIKKTETVDLLRDKLPAGDIIIKYKEYYYASNLITKTKIETDMLEDYSVKEFVSLFLGSWDDVEKVYYTGLSTGGNEIVEVDFSEFL